MEQNTIMLAGLESNYMNRLALYLSERFGSRSQVGVCSEVVPDQTMAAFPNRIWLTSEAFADELRALDESVRVILLEENGIFPYQSREQIYRELLRAIAELRGVSEVDARHRKKHILAVTSDASAGTLVAYSITCALLLAQNASVLYVNFSQCSGMDAFLGLRQEERELGDLILSLRKGNEICLESYAGHLERFDYLLSPINPAILQEFTWEDMRRLLELIQNSGPYQWIVFSIGCTMCGCEQIFAEADRIIHVTGGGGLHKSSCTAWQEFIRQCLGEKETCIELVKAVPVDAETTGAHLPGEWAGGAIGSLLRPMLEKTGDTSLESLGQEGGMTHDHMAGYSGTDSWRP